MARRRIHPPSHILGTEESEPAHIPLDRTRIIQTALQLLNEIGLRDLSMRKIADRLQVKTASLYYHVKDKDELLQWLGDKISENMIEPDPSLPWEEQIVQWCGNFRKLLHSHRDAVEIFNSALALGYGRLTQIEKLFQLFVSAGFQDSQIPWMAAMLKNYVLGFVAEEGQLVDLAGKGDTAVEELGEQYSQFHRHLPEEQFPNMIRLAPYTTSTDWKQEFQFGLGVIIDGFSLKLSSGKTNRGDP
ncbi:TetR/AcrR family transcriptional regulator C-terminal domain-containing protein [Cohnella silvisoli]|uniref:TetR/AcrR family transcriptional regulator C-terminal domain-containing protein n=1 Tax=Cohnella silvisoli TaxID=2873699 RepID=A0ABV1KZG9_9BACL|nr:TetR/AcrR family transcriptional regulator C-terminal domain-containing protein [Cohnella silvisoli]MCD9024714.1 TetR/AcrR family transcriptional regulator C-terminal domain-containing protein [Cohnella silvisoli]